MERNAVIERENFFLRRTCHLLYDIKSGKCKWSSSTSQEKCQEKLFFLTLHENIGRLLWKSVGKRIWTIHLPPEISRTIWKMIYIVEKKVNKENQRKKYIHLSKENKCSYGKRKLSTNCN